MMLPRSRAVPALIDLSAMHPSLGLGAGIGLVAVLVPVLTLLGGQGGTLGPSLPLFFLVPVLIASTSSGRLAGVVVSVVAIAAWDFFFIPPLYTVTIYYPRDLLALIVFLVVAVLTGQLATATRTRAEAAIRRVRTLEALHELSTALITRRDVADILRTLADSLRRTFDLEACALLLRGDGGVWRTAASAGAIPPDLRVETSRTIAGIASGVSSSGEIVGYTAESGRRSGTAAKSVRFVPLLVDRRSAGVLEVILPDGMQLDQEHERLLMTFANGAAIALEQARLAREEESAAVARASDALKTALLSSVSHDLRTPLAGIKAAASSLLQQDIAWSDEDRRRFITDINDEADRLTRLVSNLLDLSRIEGGALRLEREWEYMPEVVNGVLQRLQQVLTGRQVVVDVPSSLPPVEVDAVRIEQVLINLLENAAKYSPAGAGIEIRGVLVDAPDGNYALQLSVTDHGPGIPPAHQAHIFDKFYRITGGSRSTSGSGLGLAIVKGFVEAHGGQVTVRSVQGSGTTFTVVLPVADAPAFPAGSIEP